MVEKENIWSRNLRNKVACCVRHNHEGITNKESAHLSVHFQALSEYLQQSTPDAPTEKRLKHIFESVSKHHNGLVRNDYVVTSAAAHNAFMNKNYHQVGGNPISSSTENFTAGFVALNAEQRANRGGVNFAFIALPDNIASRADLNHLHPLVTSLQNIYTLTNHDWLHHFTISALTKETCSYKNDDREVERWAERHFSEAAHDHYPVFEFSEDETLYEGWAIYTHAKVLDTEAGQTLKNAIITEQMAMINHAAEYARENDEEALKTSYWFVLQSFRALRRIMSIDDMCSLINYAANVMPHPNRLAYEQAEHIKARLYYDCNEKCLLFSPDKTPDQEKAKKFRQFTNDNAKITAEVFAHLDRKFA